MGRVSVMAAPQLSRSRVVGVTPNLQMAGRGMIASPSNRRPGNSGEHRYRRPYVPLYGVGVPYGVAVWPGPGYLGYPDSGFYDDSSNVSPAVPVNYTAEGDGMQPIEQSEATPSGSFGPAYAGSLPSPEPEAESAVTLVFKDGRPVEQIHNYILTRTMLYVRDEHRRDIPVDQLDQAATEKVNRDAGGDFQLPTGAINFR